MDLFRSVINLRDIFMFYIVVYNVAIEMASYLGPQAGLSQIAGPTSLGSTRQDKEG